MVLVAIVGAVYMVSDIYSNYRLKQDLEAYMQGQNDAISQLVSLSINCEPVVIPLNENQTITLIAIGCLQQREQNV